MRKFHKPGDSSCWQDTVGTPTKLFFYLVARRGEIRVPSGDRGTEFDGDDCAESGAPCYTVGQNDLQGVGASVPLQMNHQIVYNLTLIGSTPDAGAEFPPVSAASTNRGIQFRNGYAGAVHNSIVVNTGAETGIELDTSAVGVPGFTTIDNANNGLVALVCSTLDDGAAPAAQETTVINNGNGLNLALGGTAAGANTVNVAAFPGLVKEDATFPLTGNAAGKLDASLKSSPINPRPAAGFVGVGGCVAPAGPNLSAAGFFRGAFPSGPANLWTTGWTALNTSGLLAN